MRNLRLRALLHLLDDALWWLLTRRPRFHWHARPRVAAPWWRAVAAGLRAVLRRPHE